MNRRRQHELLDEDEGNQEEIAGSFRDLQLINRWFGGIDTTRRMLRRVARQKGLKQISLLDVAAGDGFATKRAAGSLQSEAVHVRVVTMDRRMSHITAATNQRSGAGSRGDVVVGDALALPFRDEAFDVVLAALFVHHLSEPEVIRFLDEALRVSRVAVLINDLHRAATHLGLVYAGLPLFQSRVTRHDAVASVRQAFTAQELAELLKRTRAVRAEVRRNFLYRIAAIAWK